MAVDRAAASRWAHVAERRPAHLDELSAPATGTMELPLHLARSGLRRFELSDEKQLLGMCRRIVLTTGLRENLTGYPHAALLVGRWPRLRIAVGKPVRTRGEQRFPKLLAAAAGA